MQAVIQRRRTEHHFPLSLEDVSSKKQNILSLKRAWKRQEGPNDDGENRQALRPYVTEDYTSARGFPDHHGRKRLMRKL